MHISEKNKDEIRVVLKRMSKLIQKKAKGVTGYEGISIDLEHSKNVQLLNISSEAKKYLRNKYYAEVAYEVAVRTAAAQQIKDEDFLYVVSTNEEITTPTIVDPKEIEAELVRKILAKNRQLAGYKKYQSYSKKSKSKNKNHTKSKTETTTIKKRFSPIENNQTTTAIPTGMTFEELSKFDTSRVFVPMDINPRSNRVTIMAKINRLKDKRTSLVQSIVEYKQPSLFDMFDTDYDYYRKNTEIYFEKFNAIASQVSVIEKELAELHSWLEAPYQISSIEQLINLQQAI